MTKKVKKEKKKTDAEILFPEVVVGDITIKPWNFGILFKISDLLDQVITKMEEKDITLDEGFISYVQMVKIFTLASSQVLTIMSVTLDMEEEDIASLPMEDGIKIAGIIAKQNWSIISKNFLALLPQIPEMEETDQTNQKSQKENQKESQ